MYPKTRNKSLLLISLLALSTIYGVHLIAPLPAFSATYYVSVNGDNSNPGTLDQPWRTIQQAANTVKAGDTVIVQSGTYDERILMPSGKSGSPDAKITFKADPRRSVYIKGFRGNSNNYIRVEGFNITYVGGWLGGGIWLDGNHWEIVDNYFYEVTGAAIQPTWQSGKTANNAYVADNKMYKCNKGFVVGGYNWLVERNEVERLVYYNEDADYSRFFGEGHIIRNNLFHGTLAEEIGQSHVDGFQTFGNNGVSAKNIIIENNIVKGYHHQGFMMTGDWGLHENITIRNNIIEGSTAWGICAMGITNLKVYNNVFVNMGIHGVWFRWETRGNGRYPTTGEVKNNIFYNVYNLAPYGAESGCTLTASNNLLYKSGYSYNPQHWPNDIVNQDPKFVNVVDKNFKLQSNSPAIDSGTTLLGFSHDIENRFRPQGKAWDIGAYEYTNKPLPPSGLRIIYDK